MTHFLVCGGNRGDAQLRFLRSKIRAVMDHAVACARSTDELVAKVASSDSELPTWHTFGTIECANAKVKL